MSHIKYILMQRKLQGQLKNGRTLPRWTMLRSFMIRDEDRV